MYEVELTVQSLMEEPACQLMEELGAAGSAVYADYEPLSADEIWTGMEPALQAGMCKVVAYFDELDEGILTREVEEKIKEYQSYGLDFGTYGLEIREIMDIDWAQEHKKYYSRTTVEDILICPSWDAEGIEDVALSVILEPGAAFGTGLHETTQLCMRLINRYFKAGGGFYDIGCGSGILGILAMKKGADWVIAADMDEIAVTATKRNADLNDVLIDVRLADLAAACEEMADMMAANIIAPVLKELIPAAKAYIKPNGLLLLSGILDTQVDEMTACLKEHGYEVIEMLAEGEWVAIVAKNKAEEIEGSNLHRVFVDREAVDEKKKY